MFIKYKVGSTNEIDIIKKKILLVNPPCSIHFSNLLLIKRGTIAVLINLASVNLKAIDMLWLV